MKFFDFGFYSIFLFIFPVDKFKERLLSPKKSKPAYDPRSPKKDGSSSCKQFIIMTNSKIKSFNLSFCFNFSRREDQGEVFITEKVERGFWATYTTEGWFGIIGIIGITKLFVTKQIDRRKIDTIRFVVRKIRKRRLLPACGQFYEEKIKRFTKQKMNVQHFVVSENQIAESI